MERPNAWQTYSADQLEELERITGDYRAFISDNKTEREACASAVELARAAGYVDLADCVRDGRTVHPGDKVYAVNRGKSLLLAVIGREGLEHGVNILGAHIDSPRLDIKQNPLDERDGLAYLDTHYYGGIKKYQWVTLPLAIHGVVARKDGSVVTVAVGEDPADPVFAITDILPHLGREQAEKKAGDFIDGEMLDLLVGSRAADAASAGSDAASAGADRPAASFFLKVVADKLGCDEEDFLSAELEVVPAGRAREMGADRSMILGYGQDDRVCAYTSLLAQLACEAPERTAVTLLVDKEEIGSVSSWSSRASPATSPCAAAWPARACCRPTSPRPLTPSSRACSRRRTPPSSATVWPSTSSRVRAASRAPTTPTPSTWPTSAA